jgi:hypothetical protein
VAVNPEIRETGAIACVKKLSSGSDIQKDVRTAHGV